MDSDLDYDREVYVENTSVFKSQNRYMKKPIPSVTIRSLNNKNTDDIFEVRNMDNVSEDVTRVVNLLTLKAGTQPVGSFKYAVFDYPGDVDIFEMVEGCCTVHGLSKSISKRIINMVRRLKITKNVYFTDFKAGLDIRYNIDIGENNIVQEGIKVINYNPEYIIETINKLYSDSLIIEEEHKELIDLVKPSPISMDDWESLNDKTRNLRIIRWTEDEIIQGWKMLRGNLKITLEKAIRQGTIVKIDVVALISRGYVEVTNYFAFVIKNKEGRKVYLTKKLGNYRKSVLEDLLKYSSTQFRDSLKFAKRMWLIAAMTNSQYLGKALAPLFISPAAAIAQVVEESRVCQKMLTNIDDVPIEQLMFQILEFEKTLKNNIPRRYEILINQRIENIYTLYTKTNLESKEDKLIVVKLLDSLNEELVKLVEQYSFLYLRKMELNPAYKKENIPIGRALLKILRLL